MAQSFYPSAQTLIDASIRACRGYDSEGGLSPSTTQRTNALEALNFIVTSWQALGMQVWCQKIGTWTLTAATNSTTVGPTGGVVQQRPLSVQQAFLRDTTVTPNLDIPLRVVSREEYETISAKTTTGIPNMIFYDPTYSVPDTNSGVNAAGNLYCWPVPDASIATRYDIQFIYTRPIQDFAATTDALDFPQEWYNAVKWNLVVAIAPEYGVPLAERNKFEEYAKTALDLASGWDTEKESLTVAPSKDGE